MREIYNIRGRSLTKVSGWLMILESLMMIVPLITGLCTDGRDIIPFLIAAGATGVVGATAVVCNRQAHTRLYRREGYLLISFIWVLFSLFGMIPFMLSDHPLGFTDAFFETMSGFTTTGASAFADVEVLSKGVLLWRAMIQWLGGLGIVFFLIAVLPALNDTGGIALFNAEITGISHDKLHPRIRSTALSIWSVYGLLTLILIPLLWVGGMDFFDSVCQALSTVSTGGFSTRNGSIGDWGSTYIAVVVTVFMLLGGVNFVLIYNFVKGRKVNIFRNDVLRVFLCIVVCAAIIIGICVYCLGARGFNDVVVGPLFGVASAITSTGFGYADFSAWGPLPVLLIFLLMLCGACAGSTSGGIKTDRMFVLAKNVKGEVIHTLYPKHIQYVKVGGKSMEQEVLIRIMAFISLYLIIVSVGALIMAAYGYDIVDSYFASASCMGNDGLGLGATGSGFGELPGLVKWMFSFQMLVGRLEIFTVLVLFYPAFWQK